MSGWGAQEVPELIAGRQFLPSEIGLALEELRAKPDWLKDLVSFYGQSHRGLAHWLYLSCLAAITSGIEKPIEYAGSPIRSKIHLLLKGQTGGGKGFIMGVIEDLFPKVEIQGVATSAAVLGSISGTGTREGGRWTPGKAFHARHGILLIRELFQSLRSGEFYSDISNDMNEILEYPHRVTKSIVSARISDDGRNEVRQLYGQSVTFPRPNEFSYEAPCVVIAGVPELSLNTLLSRVSEGFMSRFFDVPIGYTKGEALDGLKTFWDNVLLTSVEDSDLSVTRFRRMCYVLYAANMGWLVSRGVEPLKEIILPARYRDMFQVETQRALEDCWSRLSGPDKGENFLNRQTPPPILFRECGDVLRIAVADTVSRRFSGTERGHTGVVEIDSRAATVAIEYLNVLAETRTKMFEEAMKVQRFRVPLKPAITGLAFDIIRRCDIEGISKETLVELLIGEYGFSQREANQQIMSLMTHKPALVEQMPNGRIISCVVARFSRQQGGLFGFGLVPSTARHR